MSRNLGSVDSSFEKLNQKMASCSQGQTLRESIFHMLELNMAFA